MTRQTIRSANLPNLGFPRMLYWEYLKQSLFNEELELELILSSSTKGNWSSRVEDRASLVLF